MGDQYDIFHIGRSTPHDDTRKDSPYLHNDTGQKDIMELNNETQIARCSL